ncbi:hypothetical protein ACCO45_013847 [Purpureocillium lilacinum]|uniref:Uncharacterized protein n=1 Tax=Purpureocillium lilacinum TaxID=33203 RepID=A0ACC4DA14_PURLI
MKASVTSLALACGLVIAAPADTQSKWAGTQMDLENKLPWDTPYSCQRLGNSDGFPVECRIQENGNSPGPSEQTLTWACGGEHGCDYCQQKPGSETTFMCNDSPELATYRKTMPDECFQQDGVVANCKQVYDDCLAQKMKEDKPDEIEQCIKSTFEEGDKPLFPGEGKRPSAHYSRPGQTSQASQAPWQKCLANAKDQAAKAKCFIDRENEFCGGLESDKTGCSNAIRSCHYDLYRKTGSTKKPAEDGQKQWDNIVACAKDRLAQTPIVMFLTQLIQKPKTPAAAPVDCHKSGRVAMTRCSEKFGFAACEPKITAKVKECLESQQ